MMTKRYIAAFALLAAGFLLIIGSVGKMEFDGFISPTELFIKAAVGIALMAAAVPVSGDVDFAEIRECSRKRKNRR